MQFVAALPAVHHFLVSGMCKFQSLARCSGLPISTKSRVVTSCYADTEATSNELDKLGISLNRVLVARSWHYRLGASRDGEKATGKTHDPSHCLDTEVG